MGKYFQVLFQEQYSNCIEYQGQTYYRYYPIISNGSITLKFRFISAKSKYNQAIVTAFPREFAGEVRVNGHKAFIRSKAFPRVIFWQDMAPKEFEVEITGFCGTVQVCNGSDPIGTKEYCKHLSEGCAMKAEKYSDNKYRFYCHDHDFEGECDNLIFEVEIMKNTGTVL